MNTRLYNALACQNAACCWRQATHQGRIRGAIRGRAGALQGSACERDALSRSRAKRADAGQGYALKLTAGGLNAIAVDEAPEQVIEPIEAPQPRPLSEATIVCDPDNVGEQAKKLAPRAGSKLALAIDLLQRSDGATIPILTEATGWLPHTTRAALAGLRKRGYAVVRERIGTKDSVYRMAGPATGGGDRSIVEPGACEDHDREPKPKANQAA